MSMTTSAYIDLGGTFNTDDHDHRTCGCPWEYHTQDCTVHPCPSMVDEDWDWMWPHDDDLPTAGDGVVKPDCSTQRKADLEHTLGILNLASAMLGHVQ